MCRRRRNWSSSPDEDSLGLGLVFFLGRLSRFLHEVRDPLEFLLEAGHEIVRAVLEEDDEAESEEDEKREPKERAE